MKKLEIAVKEWNSKNFPRIMNLHTQNDIPVLQMFLIINDNTRRHSSFINHYTANDYRQTTDILIFKHVISTLR